MFGQPSSNRKLDDEETWQQTHVALSTLPKTSSDSVFDDQFTGLQGMRRKAAQESVEVNGQNSERPKIVDDIHPLPVAQWTPMQYARIDLVFDRECSDIPPGKVGIEQVSDQDVLSGRGSGTNLHRGNKKYRDLVGKYRPSYASAKNNEKSAFSRGIVREVRSWGGRFLRKDKNSGLYHEIGDARALEKTSQALRQRSADMRRIMREKASELIRAIPYIAKPKVERPSVSRGQLEVAMPFDSQARVKNVKEKSEDPNRLRMEGRSSHFSTDSQAFSRKAGNPSDQNSQQKVKSNITHQAYTDDEIDRFFEQNPYLSPRLIKREKRYRFQR